MKSKKATYGVKLMRNLMLSLAALGLLALGACAGGAGYTYLPTAGATGTTSFALTGREEYVTGTIAIAPAP